MLLKKEWNVTIKIPLRQQDTFLIIGMSCSMEFRMKSGCGKKQDILRLEEGRLEAGQWKRDRILNGDEKISLSFGVNAYSF
ncbi:MAG: DUF5597 domain-containing protein [Blautia sp.]|nr:DUF5597 domain-containing protein [Blautia sp.]